jgi:hypothetical protein
MTYKSRTEEEEILNHLLVDIVNARSGTIFSNDKISLLESWLASYTSVITPVTDGMTLTASWVTRGTAYSTLSNATSASVRVDATISNTDSGILMEAGGSSDGLIMYVFAGVLYFQCGDGSAFGSGGSRAELSYTLPVGTTTPIIEWSADGSNAVLYVGGVEVDSQTFSNSLISGGDAGTVGRVANTCAVNRGGWSSDGAGDFSGTIALCNIFNGQVTPEV